MYGQMAEPPPLAASEGEASRSLMLQVKLLSVNLQIPFHNQLLVFRRALNSLR